MLLFQNITIAIEMLTRNQKVSIYSITYWIFCLENTVLTIVERKKLATSYFYSQAKVLQQACHSISLPGEH